MINESNDTTRSQKNVLRENLALTHTARSRTRLCVTQRKVTTSRKQFFIFEKLEPVCWTVTAFAPYYAAQVQTWIRCFFTSSVKLFFAFSFQCQIIPRFSPSNVILFQAFSFQCQIIPRFCPSNVILFQAFSFQCQIIIIPNIFLLVSHFSKHYHSNVKLFHAFSLQCQIIPSFTPILPPPLPLFFLHSHPFSFAWVLTREVPVHLPSQCRGEPRVGHSVLFRSVRYVLFCS